jgi:hypothetical protein
MKDTAHIVVGMHVVDAEGARQIVKLKEPLLLLLPAGH